MDTSFWTLNATEMEKVLLRGEIIKKLREINAPNQDESLADYILVLLANKHPFEKIVRELEDFLTLQLSLPFVEWLFVCAMEIIKQKNFQPPAFINEESIMFQQQESSHIIEQPILEVEMEPLRREENNRNFGEENLKRRDDFANKGNNISSRRQQQPPLDGRSRQRRSMSRDREGDYHQRPRRSDRLRRVMAEDDESDSRYSRSRIMDARELIRRDGDDRDRRRGGRGSRGDDGRPVSSRSGHSNVDEKCKFWPNCKEGEQCVYVHPTKKCEHFPLCSFGDKCLFIHPMIPCKYQLRCQNPSCNYQHMSLLETGSVKSNVNIPCKFHPNCRNVGCPFLHPIDSDCRFGKECNRPSCPFKHLEGRSSISKTLINEPCKFGSKCSKVDCSYKHGDGEIEMMMMVQSPISLQENLNH